MKFNLLVDLDEIKLLKIYEKIGIPVKSVEECLINEILLDGREFDLKIEFISKVNVKDTN